MNRNTDDREQQASFQPAPWLTALCVAAVVVGVVGLVLGFVRGPILDAWLWILIGFLIVGGVAQGILIWAAIFRATQTRWAPAVNRLGHSAVGFIIISFPVLLFLLSGVEVYVPWIRHPIPEKAAWLNVPFMVGREIVLFGLLMLLSFLLVRWSLNADEKAARGETPTQREQSRLTALGVVLVILYPIVFTVLCWDFIMSLSPQWISTMFGPFYFVTNLYVSMAVLVILSALLRRHLGVVRYLDVGQFHDMGNLMLGLGLFSMGLFFAQYLTIWYGNLPWETFFLVNRYLKGPWPVLGWTAFILGYGIPFVVLQSRELKRNPRQLPWVAVLAIVGVALERYVLVVPSVKPGDLMLSPVSMLGLLAFIGVFVLAVVAFLKRYSSISAAEAALPELDRLEAVP